MKQIYPRLRNLMQGNHFSKIATRIAGVFLLTLLLNVSVFAADRYSVASGNWNATTTWSATSGGAPGASVPSSTDNVFIEGAGRVVTISAVGAVSNNITILSGTLLSGGFTFTVNGNWVNNATFTAGTGTVQLSGSAPQSIGGAGTTIFNSLTNGNTTFIVSLASNITVNSVLTLQGTSNLDLASFQLNLAGAGSPLSKGVNATLTTSTSTVLYSSGSATNVLGLNYYNLNLSGGARTLPNGGSIGIANIFIPGAGVFTTTGNTINFNGSVDQPIPALTYNNLSLSNLGVKTLTGNVTVASSLSLGGGTTLNADTRTLTLSSTSPVIQGGGVFDPGTSTVVYSGGNSTNIAALNYYNLTSSNGNSRIFQNSGTIRISNVFTPNAGSYATTGSTVEFIGTSAQTITSALAFNNLIINNPTGVSLGASTVTVNGILTFSNGLLNTGGNVLVLSNAATITGAGSGKYVNGYLRYTIPTGPIARAFEIGDATNYAPVQINFGNVTAAGTLTLSTTAGDHPQIAISEINPAKSVNRVWNFVNAATTFNNYSATFNFDPSEIDAGSNTNIFSVNNYVSASNSWQFPTIGTRTATSTQATGLTAFGPFQVGEAAAETACPFNSNTNSGYALSPCIIDLTTNAQPITISGFSAGQYFTLDVIKGIQYRIYTANGSNPAQPLMLSIYNENAPADPALAVSFSNAGNTATQPNNVYYLFNSSISGKVRVLINKKRDCSATTPSGLTVRVDTYGGGNTLDDQTAAGTDSWVAHIYDGVTNVPFTDAFNNYLGNYTMPESFDDDFGTVGNSDANCFNGIYSDGNLNGTTLRISTFSTRYRMNSSKKGLYVADIGSDDGSRLAVDGNLVYAHAPTWTAGQGIVARPRILMTLTGTSALQLDYHEGTGDDRIYFNNFTKVIGNDLTTGLNQANCQGNDAVTISGDTLVTLLPNGLFREGNTTGYKWYYSLTPGGARILLPNDTLHNFTPNTATAPFNAPNTYYIYRTVSLRSTNNVNATASPFVQTIESNPAILTVTVSAPLQVVTTVGTTFCYGGGASVVLANSTIGTNYQLRNNANNAPVGAIVAGTGGPLSFATGPLYATTTFNVTAINTVNGCTVKMTNLVTFSTTPDGGKSVTAEFGLVCVGNTAKVRVTNADLGVRYLLRNDFDNTPVSDTITGVGDDLDLEIPLGYLVDPLTTFHVWALDIATGCAGKLLDTVQIATQSLSSPVFNIDQDFCSLDSGKVLLTPSNLTYNSYLWSTDSTTASIVIQQSGVFTLTVTDINGCRTTKSVNVGEELLINGDFSLGKDVGYKTGYVWAPLNPQNAPQYTINVNAKNTHANFWGRDHTTKTGNFMIINGEGPPRSIWETKVKVEPNTRYYFSAWAMSLNNAGPFARMVFNINGVNVGDTADLPAGVENNSNYGWRRFYGAWDSGSFSDSVVIKMVNLVTGNAGNDFGLDDISFSKLSPVKFFGASIGNGGNNLCLNDTLKLTAALTGGQNPITYQWRGPGGFTSTAAAPVITNAQGGWYYLDAVEGRNCQSKDSVFIILSDPTATSVAQGIYKCQSGISLYVSGMVPNSRNNTIYYTVSGITGTKVATGVDADATGMGAFYIGSPAVSTSTLLTYDTRTLTVVSIDNGSCIKAVSGVTTTLIVKPNTGIWVGPTTGGNWVDPWNWCPGLPTNTTDVIIPNGVTININDGDSAVIRDITLQGNAMLKIKNGGRLMWWRDIFTPGTGRIDATEGTIETKRDNANQNLPVNSFLNKSISTLLVGNTNGAGKVTIINDTLRIFSALLFGNNAADLETNNQLILVSSDTATARVGVIPGSVTQNVITGNFIVERYLLNTAKWRMLSAPTYRAGQTIRNSWQESGNNFPGYGFKAADPRYTAGNTLGFDQYGGNSSVKRFDPNTETWVAVANTNVDTIGKERGYLVFVQGDRSVNFPATNATRLRTTGTIFRNTLPAITVPANKFSIIGNPYPSRIDLRMLDKVRVDNTFYVWDPSLGGIYNLGGFNTLFLDGADYKNLLPSAIYGPALSVNNYIESGMAFMVKGNAANASVTFEEDDKAVESALANFNPLQTQSLLATLNLAPQAGKPAIVLDGVMAQFDAGYSNTIDDEDVKKIATIAENVSWKTADSAIVVDRRSTPQNNDTLHLQMGMMRAQNYQWELDLSNMDYPGMNAYLVDRYKSTSTLLNPTGTTTVNFSVQNITGSYAADRFKIVFKLTNVLPVTITTVTANRKADNSVQVQWKSEQELNLENYEVERSTDGRNFMSIASQAATDNAGGRATYSKTDNQYLAGDLFYRIKAISLGGQVQYSAVVKVAGIKATASINVHPNPVTGKRLNVRFTAMETGTVRLMLVNAAGQVVHTSMLNINSSNLTESIQLSSAIAAGRYQLIITSAAGFKNNQQVIIQ